MASGNFASTNQKHYPDLGSYTTSVKNRPFAAGHSRGTKPPCWRANVALGQDKQKTYIILNGNFLRLSCPSARKKNAVSLSPSLRIPRVSLAPKTPFSLPFQRPATQTREGSFSSLTFLSTLAFNCLISLAPASGSSVQLILCGLSLPAPSGLTRMFVTTVC